MARSAENLIALTGNLQTFFSQEIRPPLPYQQGPHPRYDADVAAVLSNVAAAATSMPPPGLRAALVSIEQKMRIEIAAGTYNPKVR